jgi:hypothetical protein
MDSKPAFPGIIIKSESNQTRQHPNDATKQHQTARVHQSYHSSSFHFKTSTFPFGTSAIDGLTARLFGHGNREST